MTGLGLMLWATVTFLALAALAWLASRNNETW
jgi:hypothetical protein